MTAGEASQESVELDLAWVDPELDQALTALLIGDVRPAVDLIAATAGDADRRELCVGVLGQVGESQVERLRVLAQQEPENADVWVLLGSALAQASWSSRGAAVMELTTDEQVTGMVGLGAQARLALRRAVALRPDDPVPWGVLQSCAQAACEYGGEIEDVYRKIEELGPDLYEATVRRLNILTEKWYGSEQQMLSFARNRTASLPPGHPLWALIASAHIEGFLGQALRGNIVGRLWRSARYLRKPDVLAEVDAASDQILLGAQAFTGHPSSMAAHQMFATFYHQVQNADRLRRHAPFMGARPTPWPWGYFGDYQDEFRAALAAVKIGY